MYSLIALAIGSCLISLLLTPLFRNLFLRLGWVDRPDHRRKIHKTPIPRAGGPPIAIAYVAAIALLIASPLNGRHVAAEILPLAWSLLPASLLIFLTGLLDDILNLKPWQKLVGQIAAAALVCSHGLAIHAVAGIELPHWFAAPLTVFWLIGCANAFNLIDGVDGLAAGVGLFAAITTLLSALLQSHMTLALATAPLVGALLGFLRYNFNPATVFLGDSGSLTIGFLLGCFGVVWSQKSATMLGIAAPLMALAIPLLDTGLAIVRRFLRGQPIFGADRGHIHHRLLDRGLTPRRVALILYGVAGLAAAFSLLLSVAHGRLAAAVILLFCAAAWLGIQRLGFLEFRLAGRMFLKGAFRGHIDRQVALHGFERKLGAAKTPEACWTAIRDASAEFGFHDIDMSFCGQTFQQRNGLSADQSWKIRIPLSETDYINLTREFESSALPPTIAPFADILRRTLTAKRPLFESAPPRSKSAAAGN